LDSSLSRQYEGTGLGLVLVYKFTELHGGSVQVESEIGKGSRFTIILPWSQNIKTEQDAGEGIFKSAEDSKNAPLPSGERGLILLVEDNASNILTVNEYLQDHGYTVVLAQNGLEALEKAEETLPGLILMDIQMPEMDGLEAIRRLRAISRFASTPIIALTALAMPGDRELCLQAGADEYISKPASLKMLVKTISKLLGSEA
jgi:CheY-like chemotaxis protein